MTGCRPSLDAGCTHETMAPMVILQRAALLALVTVFGTAVARAQTEPPPAVAPPPSTPGVPPASVPAPPPSPAPVAPLSPTLAPDTAPAPPLVLAERTAPEQQEARPVPLHQKTWFWAVVGVAFVTGFVVTFVMLRDRANDPPSTTFGNMNAF